MKIRALIEVDVGIPFYKVKDGQLFQIISSSEVDSYAFRRVMQENQILMKYDEVGALDYPYDSISSEMPIFVDDRVLVKVVRKTDKKYKKYVKNAQKILKEWEAIVAAINSSALE